MKSAARPDPYKNAPAKAGEHQSAGELRSPLSFSGLRLRIGLDPLRGLPAPKPLTRFGSPS